MRNEAEDRGEPHLIMVKQLETFHPDNLLDFRLWGTEDA